MEVLLVVLILAMLAGVGIFALTGTREKAKVDTTKLLLEEISSALDAFNMHMFRYPTEQEGLEALRTKPEESGEEVPGAQWAGSYLKREPRDAWGQLINYRPVEAGSPEAAQGLKFKVWSNGPDKQSETEDDIRNWQEEKGGRG
jgi:general secretion pathway protein G